MNLQCSCHHCPLEYHCMYSKLVILLVGMHCLISLPQPAKACKSCLQLEDAMCQKLSFPVLLGKGGGGEILRFKLLLMAF